MNHEAHQLKKINYRGSETRSRKFTVVSKRIKVKELFLFFIKDMRLMRIIMTE